MIFYQIGSLVFSAEHLPACYDSFIIEQSSLSEQQIADRVILSARHIPHEKANLSLVATHQLMKVYTDGSNGWLFEEINGHGTLSVSPDYRIASFYSEYSEKNNPQGYEESLKPLLQAMLECRLIWTGTMVLHCACVEKDGKAICFSGPSGVGKSTRARKWVNALGAEWISGDRPAISVEKQEVYGVPWDGKEQIFRNVQCPLHAIVEVHRAPFTRVRRLTAKQAYHFLASQLLIPMWDTELAAKAMEQLRRMMETMSVYRLFCDRTETAAEEAYQILFSRTDQIMEENDDMKMKDGFVLRSIAGEYMVMPAGDNIATYNGSVVLNEVSAFLLEQMKQPISKEDLLELMLNEYDVDRETAAADLDKIIQIFEQLGLIE